MKFSYALIRKFIPQAPPPSRLAAGLNAHSFEVQSAHGDLLDINLPANVYSHAASHAGIARETATIFGLKFKNPILRIVNPPARRGLVDAKVDEVKLCSRYAARYFKIPKIGSSPFWMQKILRTCGMKPVNNIVDLMNFVMLETGQPLHAFDFDAIANTHKSSTNRTNIREIRAPIRGYPRTIIVRRAGKGEKIETLDRQTFTLDPDVLVIAGSGKNSGGALAIAGVKGGLHSGVSKSTRRIIVEAANFDGASVYRAAVRLKLLTEASARFSHSISPALVDFGMDRVTALLRDLGAVLLDSVDVYPKPAGDAMVEFEPERYQKLIGAPVLITEAKRTFESLGFEAAVASERDVHARNRGKARAATPVSLLVRVPASRTDIEGFEDLAEEIARLSGLNELPKTPPLVSVSGAHEEDVFVLKDRIRSHLVQCGLDEVYNYSFVGDADVHGLRAESRLEVQHRPASGPRMPASLYPHESAPVELENPIAEDKKYLRPSLLPLLLKIAESNARFFDQVRVFEIGRIFSLSSGQNSGSKRVEEKLSLGIALASKKNPGLIRELKGITGDLLQGLGVQEFSFAEHKGLLRIKSDHQILGTLIPFSLERGWEASACELDMSALEALVVSEREFKPMPKYPAVFRDISVLVDRSVRLGRMTEEIQAAGPEFLEDVDLVDEYRDGSFKGKQSVTLRLLFQSEHRTLSDAEVNKAMEKITFALHKAFGALVR